MRHPQPPAPQTLARKDETMQDLKFQLTIEDLFGHTGRPKATKTLEAPDLNTAQSKAAEMVPGDLISDQFISLDEVMVLDETEFMPYKYNDARYYLTLGYLRKHGKLLWGPAYEENGWTLGDNQGGWEWQVFLTLVEPTTANINQALGFPPDSAILAEFTQRYPDRIPARTEFLEWKDRDWDLTHDQFFDLTAALPYHDE